MNAETMLHEGGQETVTVRRELGKTRPFKLTTEAPLVAEAQVEGALPAWLSGDLVRTAPALFERSAWKAEHWFDALGMLFRWRVDGAHNTARFDQRVLDTVSRANAEAGKGTTGFGTPSQRSLFHRVLNPVGSVADNTNVHVIPWDGGFLAMTETRDQNRIDRETLSVTGRPSYRDDVGEVFMLAHPVLDREKKTLINLATAHGPRPSIVLYEQSLDGWTRRLLGRWRVARVPYLHSFGMTPKHVVTVAGPLTVDSKSLLFSGRSYLDHFAWRPEDGTEIARFDRSNGNVAVHRCEAMFVFHTVGAWEEDGATVVEVCAYPDAAIVDGLRTEAMARGMPVLTPKLVRLRLVHGVERAEVAWVGEVAMEFPVVDAKGAEGGRHGVAFGAAIAERSTGLHAEVLRVDTRTGESVRFSQPGEVFGEPVFVGDRAQRREGEGVLLVIGHSTERDRTSLYVLDAERLDVRAKACVETSVPLGFHGSFSRAAGQI